MSERLVMERFWLWFETLLSMAVLFAGPRLPRGTRRHLCSRTAMDSCAEFFVCRAVCRLRDTIDRILASDRALSLVVAMVRPPHCGLLRCAGPAVLH